MRVSQPSSLATHPPTRMGAGWVISCLVLFALPAAAVDFFHTEHELAPCDSCPACQVRQATSSEVVMAAVVVPVPVAVATVEPLPPSRGTELGAAEPSARGPPAPRAVACATATPA